MGLRGPKPKPVELKILGGTLNKSREVHRLALEKQRELEREREAEDRRFVRGIINFFMDEPVEEAWLEEALRLDINGLASQLWTEYEADFRREYALRHPGKPEPVWWRRFDWEMKI